MHIIIRDHIPFTHACVLSMAYVHVFSILHIFDLLAHCMHVPIAVELQGWVFVDSSSQLHSDYPPWPSISMVFYKYNKTIKLRDEVGMAGSTSTQTRFVGIITSTIWPYMFFSRLSCTCWWWPISAILNLNLLCMWEKFMLSSMLIENGGVISLDHRIIA